MNSRRLIEAPPSARKSDRRPARPACLPQETYHTQGSSTVRLMAPHGEGSRAHTRRIEDGGLDALCPEAAIPPVTCVTAKMARSTGKALSNIDLVKSICNHG